MRTHLPHHPTQLYLIRHGEVEERYHKIFGGCRIDMSLSPRGILHGKAIAKWLADTKLDAVYASPMTRVRQTMAPLLAQRDMEPNIIDDLREMDFGDWTGCHWEGIQERFGVSAFDWLEIIEDFGIPNGETAQHLKDRVRPALLRILGENPHRSAAIFCHGGIIRIILALLLEMPLKFMAHFNVEYGSISTVEIDPNKKHAIEVELLNFCPPLHAVAPEP